MTRSSPDTAEVRFGFASYAGGKFELIAINIKTGEEIMLEGQLRPDQTLEQIDKVLPTCVYVNGVAQAPLCPRCKVNRIDRVLLGTQAEGHICGDCWAADRHGEPQTARDKADYKIGWWLSAALEDPSVCTEMKADINAWFEAHQPGLISDASTLSRSSEETVEGERDAIIRAIHKHVDVRDLFDGAQELTGVEGAADAILAALAAPHPQCSEGTVEALGTRRCCGRTVVTHRLRERHPLNAIGANPLIVSLRYRCQCNENEVLQIGMAIDMNTTEEMFMMTVKQMWRDVQFEVEQHLKPPATLTPADGGKP